MGHLLLHEENIVVGLDASNRDDAFKKIVDSLPEGSLRGITKQKILKLLALREQVGTTAIGQGIALPHCFSSDIHEPLMAFGVSAEGVTYPSLDGLPVHFIFLMVLPQNEAGELQKRQILQNVKWVLCDRYMQERLKAATTSGEILHLMAPDEQHVLAGGV